MTNSPCRFCGEASCHTLLDFGEQPLTNRYLTEARQHEFVFPFAIAQCSGCGIVQLAVVPDPDELRSRFPWIVYNEPEGHLDDVALRVMGLPGVGASASVAGLSYKDDSTLARLKRLGVEHSWRLDLGGDEPGAGLETLQQRFTPRLAEALAEKFGRVDVLVVRHVLEHAHYPAGFITAVVSLIKPGGHIIFEVPDCTRSLDLCDYSMPWEEHVAYFTPTTLQFTLERHGLEIVSLREYPYVHENSLVAICRAGAGSAGRTVIDGRTAIASELGRGARYASEFPRRRAAYRSRLAGMRGTIALFGAGHLTATFVNILQLAGLADCVIDDNPQKHGLFMPGSRLPIVPSTALGERSIATCLLGVRPEIEDLVRDKHRQFIQRGGEMFSIFPGAAHPIPLDLNP